MASNDVIVYYHHAKPVSAKGVCERPPFHPCQVILPYLKFMD